MRVKGKQEPVEWAGLPSEPARPESVAERLTNAAPAGVAGLGPGDVAFGSGGAVESIVIPVTPVVETAQAQESGDGG